MARAMIILNTVADREKAKRWVDSMKWGGRIEFKDTKRSIPQNDRMWAMLSDVAVQATHAGKKYTPDQWKVIFMHACGREVQFIPSLDGSTFIPWGSRSSDLSKQEMSDLMEFISAWCAENGITLHDDPPSLQSKAA